jgi:citrate lyase subunit beta/citryl-CoA lyase
MNHESRLIRSWLYAPANHPRHVEKVFKVGADAVILDLEDAVPAAEKHAARASATAAIGSLKSAERSSRPVVTVRVNPVPTGLYAEDLRAIVQPNLDGIRLAKVESGDEVKRVSSLLDELESRAAMPPNSIFIVCAIESAAGLLTAQDIIGASPRILALGFGAADYSLDVNAIYSTQGLETVYARSHLVLVSRARGIAPPIDGVWANVADVEGLRTTSVAGRAYGMFGRTCIHPTHVPIINEVYTPTAQEVEWAQEVIESAAAAEAIGRGALQIANGDFVDVPILRRAERIVRFHRQLAASQPG